MKTMKNPIKSVFSKFSKRKADTREKGFVSVGNFQGIGKRDNQEDSFYVSDYMNKKQVTEKGIMAVVADGMGGLSNGEEMSGLVTGTACDYFAKNSFVDKEDGNAISRYLKTMLAEIVKKAEGLQTDDEEEDCGSTMVAVLLKGDELYFMSVGDSRIYLVRDNKMYRLNREHNVGSRLAEHMARGEMLLEDYQDTKGKSGLTSFIGLRNLSEYDLSIRPLHLKNGDVVMLMSDGVFGTLSDLEMLECISEDCEQTARKMKAAVEAAGKRRQDNFTGVIIRYQA